MFREFFRIIKDILKQFFSSRLFPVMSLFVIMFSCLVIRLFNLQIVEQEQHMENYIQKSLTEVSVDSTRGNIYDRNGVLLAYNQLVYSVTLKDTGVYVKQAQKNQWVYELVTLLASCNQEIDWTLPLDFSSEPGETYCFTTTSTAQKKRLLRDVYGLKNVNQLDDPEGKYPSDITADEVVALLEKKFYFERWVDADGNPIQTDPHTKLSMLNIRWELNNMRYTKYKSIVVASDVSQETMACVLEHANRIIGVDIEEEYIRVYPDGLYFSHIIGYTGKASTDQLAELQLQDPSYEYGDTIGRSGVEALMELELKGTKGSKSMYLDSSGKVIEVISEEEAIVGKDVYLTIDHDLTIAGYYIIEQTLASVILDKLVFEDVDVSQLTSDDVVIPVKKVYDQLFNNNVIDLAHLRSEEASETEYLIYQAYLTEYTNVIQEIRQVLENTKSTPNGELSEELQEYMDIIFDYLYETSGIIVTEEVDTSSAAYKDYTAGKISLREFIYEAIANEWIDNTLFEHDDKYTQSDVIFEQICEMIYSSMEEEDIFSKMVYHNLIYNEIITGAQVCLVLFEQGILEHNEDYVAYLMTASDKQAFDFIKMCIKNIWITPAQLALDPCNASTVVTDVNTGEVLALVSYPGYDINMFSGKVDATYYNSLLNDASNPLFNYATQSRTSPGSTYKMLTSIAGLEEGVISTTESIECLGLYDRVSPAPKCWIYVHDNVSTHGPLSLVGALANSCNFYYYDVGYRLSTDTDGTYNEALGLATLKKYAEMFGFGTISGVEINEAAPKISDALPIPSSIGQGTNAYTTAQVARYVTAIASRGTLYSLSILDKVCDAEGNVVKDYTPEQVQIEGVSQNTFFTVQAGMRAVVQEGTVREYFKDVDIEIAGKTGSAQEDIHRPNHAWFVSYAPYENPEITITVNIRNGYTSAYSATISRELYKYYYHEYTLEEIMDRVATGSTGPDVAD